MVMSDDGGGGRKVKITTTISKLNCCRNSPIKKRAHILFRALNDDDLMKLCTIFFVLNKYFLIIHFSYLV
jgi:hypothetical protein